MFEVKADCDRNFEALTRDAAGARGRRVRVAVASHNLRSVVARDRLSTGCSGGDDARPRAPGAARPRRRAPGTRWPRGGFRVRTYCPVGDLVAGMAYLVRRLLENTSNESFLSEQARGVPLEELLAAP